MILAEMPVLSQEELDDLNEACCRFAGIDAVNYKSGKPAYWPPVSTDQYWAITLMEALKKTFMRIKILVGWDYIVGVSEAYAGAPLYCGADPDSLPLALARATKLLAENAVLNKQVKKGRRP